MIFDYETLRLIWWGWLGVFLIVFAVSNGRDLGMAILLVYFERVDDILPNISHGWRILQLWLMVLGFFLLSAWPLPGMVLLAVMKAALFFVLSSFLVRPLGFCLSARFIQRTRKFQLVLSGIALLTVWGLGMGVGIIMQGVAFEFELQSGELVFNGLTDFFSLYAMLTAMLTLAAFLLQGAVYLQYKTVEAVAPDIKPLILLTAMSLILVFVAVGFWSFQLHGYHISSLVDVGVVSDPLQKTVKNGPGLWLDNYGHYPVLWGIPAGVIVCAAFSALLSYLNKAGTALFFSSMMLATIVLTLGVAMFPFIIPSSAYADHSLTVWDASAEAASLQTLLWVYMLFSMALLIVYLIRRR